MNAALVNDPDSFGGGAAAGGRVLEPGIDVSHKTILYLEDISVSFDGFKALNSLSLSIDVGELRCIIGPNGAGKTTMMDVITGKTRPDAGTVFFGQTIDLTRLSEAEIAQAGIGRKFQKPTIFEQHTVFENLELAMKADKRVRRTLLVLATAPLGMIGAGFALLVSGAPFGFVALLGLIALAGMIMRNSVILVDQIKQDMALGLSRYDAIVDSTVRRARPIVLTAAAAILAMIPLTGSVFWGPMAIVIMGGLFVATLLTLLYLPALYATWFGVKAE